MTDYEGYTSPNAPQTPPPPPPEPRRRNTIGLIALITAILGFLFAVIPGALMLGWVLLPIAFILAIVGIVQKDRPKGNAVTALIVSIAGTVAGVLVFVFAMGSIIDDVFTDEPEVILPEESTTEEETASPEDSGEAEEPAPEQQEEPAAADGNRDNPVPLGSTIKDKEWEVTVVSFTRDATDEVMGANMFNDDPEESNTYALIEAEVTYTGDDSSSPWLDISFAFVTTDGNTIRSSDSFAVAPDPQFNDIGELYGGGSGSGYTVLEIPEDAQGTLRVTPGLFADDVFVAAE